MKNYFTKQTTYTILKLVNITRKEMIKIYSKIPVTIFAKENNLLKQTSDKTILILHQLSILSNMKDTTLLSIKYLIEQINYKDNDQIRNEIKTILLKLELDNLIKINSKINKSNELIVIDVSNLKQLDRFILLEDNEYKEIINSTKNKKEQLNLLKLLLYFKYKSYKRPYKESIYDTGGKANCCTQDYITIVKDTNITIKNINKYIDKLKELNLITYTNIGYKILDGKITQCNNIYVVNSLCNKDEIEIELNQAIKQQKYMYEQLGYKITKTKNKKINKP